MDSSGTKRHSSPDVISRRICRVSSGFEPAYAGGWLIVGLHLASPGMARGYRVIRQSVRVFRSFRGRGASTSSLSWSSSVSRGHPTHRCGAVGYRGSIPSVAARGPSPLPPRPSTVTGPVLGVFPRGSCLAEQVRSTCPPLTWILLQGSPSALGLGPPLLAPSACASPPTWALASTPGSPRGSPSAGSQPCGRSCSASVVSHHPGGFLRSSFAGLFHPAAGPRFTVFQPPSTLAGRLRSSSRRGSYPSKNAPRRQPFRVTTVLAFLPLSPLHFPALPRASLRAIARSSLRVQVDGRSFAVSRGRPPSSARHLRRVSPTGWLSLRPSAPRSALVGLRRRVASSAREVAPGVPLHRTGFLPRQVARRRVRGGRSGTGGLSTSGGPWAGISPRSPAEAGHLGVRWLPLPK
jgi:hypothetical protein